MPVPAEEPLRLTAYDNVNLTTVEKSKRREIVEEVEKNQCLSSMKKVNAGSRSRWKSRQSQFMQVQRSADNNKYLASMGQIKEKKIGMTLP